MHESLRFGRIAGVAVGVNWSVLVIAALVTWGLASETLPESYAGHSTVAYWIVAALASVAFFASLLTHELGHAVVARRHGVDVQAITLWMLGGVAKLEGGATNAIDELRIAAIGPAISFALAGAFAAAAFAVDLVGAPELLVAGLVWLATINLVLAVFNLLPAFPLDGGRILRGFLWRSSGDQLGATKTAAAVGRTFGYLLAVFGFLGAMGGAGVSGIWMVFIGLFITFASTAEAAQTEQEVLLGGLRVQDIMTATPVTVPASISVQSLLDDFVLQKHVSAFPVVDESYRPLGLITLDHIRRVPAAHRASTTVLSAATPLDDVVVSSPDEPVTALVPRLAPSREGRSLVVVGDRLVGIVSHTDVIRAMEVRQLVARHEEVSAV